ncbi:glycoside hydrolase domain-containing protein [Desulfosporosinus sp. SB140]|uniref:glycoside hydrolase domain-containing protein n=1 Tax=Desulfosporosinus paludis TaxID=3115649 RepID=UPI00388FF24D
MKLNISSAKGVVIYFAVEYDAQPGDMAAIKGYFHGVHTVLTGKFLNGPYGSYAVMVALWGHTRPK